MSTKMISSVYVYNGMDQTCLIQLYHKNDKYGIQSKGWIINANESLKDEPLEAIYSNNSSNSDWWFVVLHVPSGDQAGVYVSNGTTDINKAQWYQSNLTWKNQGKSNLFTVTTTTFSLIDRDQTPVTTMAKIRNFQDIQNVFVLMLENRSLDHMLAFSGLDANFATTQNYNIVSGEKFYVRSSAPTTLSKDPSHEFNHVMTQLCGPDRSLHDGYYPKQHGSNETGFALSYRNDTTFMLVDADLNFKVAEGYSPSITIHPSDKNPYLSLRAAFIENKSGENRLRVIGNNYTYLQSDFDIASGTNLSITAYYQPSNQWVLAYHATDDSLKILETNGNINPTPFTPKNIKVKAGSSPSICGRYDAQSWYVAFQNDQGSLSIYQSKGFEISPPNTAIMDNTNPSIALGNIPEKFFVAYQSSDGTLAIYYTRPYQSPVFVSTGYSMDPKASPSIGVSDDNSYAVAFRGGDGKGLLHVYESTTGKAQTINKHVREGTNPSLAMKANGEWYVAFFGNALEYEIIDQNHNNMNTTGRGTGELKTSPSLTWDHTGGVAAAYVEHTNNPVLTDQYNHLLSAIPTRNIMACFDTPNQLPVLNELAHQFTTCDHWFSSMPGPTWPNRLFAHCAGSGGLDDSPSKALAADKMFIFSFAMPNVFDELTQLCWPGSNSKLSYRLYQDCRSTAGKIAGELIVGKDARSFVHPDKRCGDFEGAGWMPLVCTLDNISFSQMKTIKSLERDLTVPNDTAYTFIEPHYGNVRDETYKGGTSQHAKDGVQGGEQLIKFVYETLRNSPLWYTSVLIVTYDEHGGFYDSHTPTNRSVPPGGTNKYSQHGYKFDRYGSRVPAIVISPMANATVNNTVFDHSSIPKTLTEVFGMPSLTRRDKDPNTHGVKALCPNTIESGNIRLDCPKTLPKTVKDLEPEKAPKAVNLDEPFPTSGNPYGSLLLLLKTALEYTDGSEQSRQEIMAEFNAIKTRGNVGAFARKVWLASGRSLDEEL